MTRVARLPIALALCGVLALGLGAATLDSAVVASDAGAIGGGSAAVEEPSGTPFAVQLPSVVYLALAVGYVASVVGGGYVLYRMYGLEFYAILLFGFLASLVWIALFGPPSLEGYEPGAEADSTDRFTQIAGSVDGSGAFVLYSVVAIGLLVAVGLLYRSTGDDVPARNDPEDEGEDERVRAVGRAAGAAATRLGGDADVENEVYRAWREMTTYLPVARPASSTPAEFADAAVEAGIDRSDVAELTDLFETVRYSTTPATETHEQRAIAALRRIEAEYADAGPTDADRNADDRSMCDDGDGAFRPDDGS